METAGWGTEHPANVKLACTDWYLMDRKRSNAINDNTQDIDTNLDELENQTAYV
jgi:hypothetical protein